MNALSKFSKRKPVSFPKDIDLETAVGKGVAVSPYEDSHSWVPIEEICNGKWNIGGRN